MPYRLLIVAALVLSAYALLAVDSTISSHTGGADSFAVDMDPGGTPANRVGGCWAQARARMGVTYAPLQKKAAKPPPFLLPSEREAFLDETICPARSCQEFFYCVA
jgi:hypothetical protein